MIPRVSSSTKWETCATLWTYSFRSQCRPWIHTQSCTEGDPAGSERHQKERGRDAGHKQRKVTRLIGLLRQHAPRSRGEKGSDCNTDRRDSEAVAENGLCDTATTGAERQAHSYLLRPPLDGARDYSVEAA